MRLNWFSPLPPARTGIAEWAAHVLPALCARAEVVVWTDQHDWQRPPGVAVEVRPFRTGAVPWGELQRADLSIYHIGNHSPSHGGIWQVSRRHPGVIVLHDLSLPHLFLGLFREELNDFPSYRDLLERFYGDAGRWLAPRLWDNRVAVDTVHARCPHTALAVDGALGVLVHTRAAQDELRPAMKWPLACLSLAYRMQRPAPAVDRAGPPYRLIICGHIGTNRCLDSILEALARFGDAAPFHLDVLGPVWDEGRIKGRIRELGLSRRVTLHGYVSDRALDTALARAHLAINLRNPTMGEASLSQLRIWESALPTLVSQTGWYATLPPTAVAHVHPERDVEDVCRHLEAFLDDPAAFARMGANGRRWLERHHSPEGYVDGLLRLCEEAGRHRPRAATYYLAERAAAEMRLWADRGADWMSEQVARPIVSLTDA
jgi:glycosyltransferase involved in cell wall biosynthesis